VDSFALAVSVFAMQQRLQDYQHTAPVSYAGSPGSCEYVVDAVVTIDHQIFHKPLEHIVC